MYVWAITHKEKIGEYEDSYWVDVFDCFQNECEYTVNLSSLLDAQAKMNGVKEVVGYGGDLYKLCIY